MPIPDTTQDTQAILIIDDMEKHAFTLARALSQYGYRVETAVDSAAALGRLGERAFSLALLDVRLGDEDGVEVLKTIRSFRPSLPVVMITAFGAVDTAVEALKSGAVDYLEKPLEMSTLVKCIRRYADEGREPGRESLVTCDPGVRDILERVGKIGPTEIPVMICGESGTGKELLAEAIHNASRRAGKVMLRVNCAALPETLLDNELFGHEKGAFTGADSEYAGFFEKAAGGTLFLDEIGDMSLSTQSRVLRAIQNREIWRVGGRSPVAIDVRFICATNRDLKSLIDKSQFRSDLFYRLDACTLTLPPLRERQGDVELLLRHFVEKYSPVGAEPEFSPSARELLLAYPWPGNVRELQNVVQYSLSMAAGRRLVDVDALPDKLRVRDGGEAFDLQEDERRRILAALRSNSYSRSRTAESLRMNRATLYRKMRKHGIS